MKIQLFLLLLPFRVKLTSFVASPIPCDVWRTHDNKITNTYAFYDFSRLGFSSISTFSVDNNPLSVFNAVKVIRFILCDEFVSFVLDMRKRLYAHKHTIKINITSFDTSQTAFWKRHDVKLTRTEFNRQERGIT